MSERAWDWAWRCRGLTPARRLVLLALAEHAGDNGETCMPAPGLLRRMTGLSRRGVAKTLNALEAVRLIAREPGGCDGATRYRLLLDRPGPALDCPGAKREDGPKDGT
jgi:DNA-binding MarR family transcriptional regulator